MKNVSEETKAQILEVMNAQAPLNMEKAEQIAEKFGVKARSIIASAVRNQIPYEKKARVSKTGGEIVSKADLVARIATKNGIDVAALEGLEKATKAALEVLAG